MRGLLAFERCLEYLNALVSQLLLPRRENAVQGKKEFQKARGQIARWIE